VFHLWAIKNGVEGFKHKKWVRIYRIPVTAQRPPAPQGMGDVRQSGADVDGLRMGRCLASCLATIKKGRTSLMVQTRCEIWTEKRLLVDDTQKKAFCEEGDKHKMQCPILPWRSQLVGEAGSRSVG